MRVKKEKKVGVPEDHFPSLLTSLSNLHSREKFTDVVFLCGKGRVNAHRAVLAPLSPLLDNLFNIASQIQAADTIFISLDEIETDVLRRVISYIYQGKCENSSREVVAMMKVCATILGLDVEIKEEAVTPLKSKEKKAKKTPMTIVHEDALLSVGRTQRAVSKKSEDSDVKEIPVETPTRGKSSKNHRKRQSKNGKATKKEDDKNKEEEEEEYEVETIIDKRKLLGEVQYLVKWKGWERVEDRTWEPLENLSGSKNLVEEYEKMEFQRKESETPKRKSDVKFVHGNGDSMSEAEESSKESPRSSRKENKRTTKDVSESPSSDLKQNNKDKKGSRKVEKTKPIISSESEDEDEEESYEVEKILKMRKIGKRTEFQIKWKGWEAEADLTWETEDNLSGAKDLLNAFLAEKEKEGKQATGPRSRKGRKSSTASKESEEVVNLEDSDEESNFNESKTKPNKKGKGGKNRNQKKSRQTKRRTKPEYDEDEGEEAEDKGEEAVDEGEEAEDAEDEYEVEKILKKRKIGKRVEYQVKWKGWDREEDLTWEPEENLSSSRELISKFESQEEEEEDLSLCEEDDCQRIFTTQTAASRHKDETHPKAEKTKAAKKSFEAASSRGRDKRKRGRSSPVDGDEPEAKKKAVVSPKPKYKPGPKSRQKILNPWMDRQSPDPGEVRSSWSKTDDHQDSSDSEDEAMVSGTRQQATFDDLFGGASNDQDTGGHVVFNKDSDDESGDGDNAVNIDDLMGGTENEEEILGLNMA